jgi:NADH-quinone oxidoreductase subunit L
MLDLLWLIPTLPLFGFVVLVCLRPGKRAVAVIGVGSVGLSALLTAWAALTFLTSPPPGHAYTQTLWTWMSVAGFSPKVALRLDALSLVMVLVVTHVGFLIHLYSAEFMSDDEGYGRYFAYMNLFVSSMLILVLAADLLLLYLGWEGVGLCSYLLIGFWYRDPENGRAARKAFVVTRIGDTAMAVGLFLLVTNLGTLDIQELMQRAAGQWPPGSGLAVAAALLLLGGALGKSAQLPLQTWLPDAMAGPTPVSALIHAATMVTAGVYLIARTNVLFTLAPPVQLAVAVIGALTLLLAGFSALTQWDIKRILAYSTISQIGYMFLALGVGAWSAAIFHFMTHAFFKALLFLAAGVVIQALHEEHNIFTMGGLRHELPVTFWTFLIGAGSLSALPLVTAGFYSKDLILSRAWSLPGGSPWLWAAGLLGAFLTSLYAFRPVFIAFFGPSRGLVHRRPGWAMTVPLVVLAFLSVTGGWLNTPPFLGNVQLLPRFLETSLPASTQKAGGGTGELALEGAAAAVSLLGLGLAYLFFLWRRRYAERVALTAIGGILGRFCFSGWGFDWCYDRLLVQPYLWLARTGKDDVIDLFYRAVAWLSRVLSSGLSRTENGRVRWYAAGLALGAAIVFAVVVWS